MIRDYQAIQNLVSKGKQRIIPTYGKHEGVKLMGYLIMKQGMFTVLRKRNMMLKSFTGSQNVLLLYSTGKIVMILDNAKVHHAKLLEPFLQENKDRLQLVFLPPYSET